MKANFPLRELLRAFGAPQDQAELPEGRSDFTSIELRAGMRARSDQWGGLRRRVFVAGASVGATVAEYGVLQLTVRGDGAWIQTFQHNTAAGGVIRVGVIPGSVALTASVTLIPTSFDDGRDVPAQSICTIGTLPAATVDAAGFVTQAAQCGAPIFRVDDLGWFLPPNTSWILTCTVANIAVSSGLSWVEARAEHEPLNR